MVSLERDSRREMLAAWLGGGVRAHEGGIRLQWCGEGEVGGEVRDGKLGVQERTPLP